MSDIKTVLACCPFCGSPAISRKKGGFLRPMFWIPNRDKVSCGNSSCGAHYSYWHPSEWNSRASQPPQEPDFWPIAKLTVANGKIAEATFYAPGLPDGTHDVFPAPCNEFH